MRQRALPSASPSRPPGQGSEALLSHRRNRSLENSTAASSSWEISASPQPASEDVGKQQHVLHYPNGYQNHHRKHVALQNVHLFYRKPLHVSDANYRAFVGLPKTPAPAPLSKQCCFSFCVGFSWIAVGFFLFVYMILRFQPLYIPHSLQHHYIERNGRTVKVSDLSKSPMATVALHTLWAYLALALICQYYSNPNRWRRQRYQDIPDHNSGPSGLDPTLPTTAIPVPIDVYQDSLWGRTMAGLKQWMLVKGYRRVKRKQFETKTV